MSRMVEYGARRFRHHVRELWKSRGGGFYGFVVVLTFLYLEAVDLAGDLVGLGGAAIDIGWLIGFLVENAVDALMNVVWSGLWPIVWIDRFGVSVLSGALLGGAYVVYRLIRPAVIRLLEDPAEAGAELPGRARSRPPGSST
jgi:hypothetical protein